jgi:hypothetical protein
VEDTHLANVAIGVLQRDNKLELVPDLNAVVVDVLHALLQALWQRQAVADGPALLAGLADHVVPVLVPRHLVGPLCHLALLLVLLVREARGETLADLQQLDRDVAHLEPLEERGEAHLERDGGAEDDGLLRDDDGVVDLVGPDVFDAHSVQELEGRGVERPDDAQGLVCRHIVGELAAGDCRLESVDDAGLGDALDALAGVAGEVDLEGPLVVSGVEDRLVAIVAPDERLPPVSQELGVLVDLGCGQARGGRLGLVPTGWLGQFVPLA